MTALGLPLAVYVAEGTCDSRRAHDLRLVTDGTRAVAEAADRGGSGCGTVYRDGTTLTVRCGQNTGPGADGEPCEGDATFMLDAPGTWTTDPQAVAQLDRDGAEVVR